MGAIRASSFTAQPIPVGHTINLSFDYRQTSPTGILRVGLYDLSGGAFSADNWANTRTGTYAGYTTFIRDNGSNIARREVANFTTAFGNGYPAYGATGVTDITTLFASESLETPVAEWTLLEGDIAATPPLNIVNVPQNGSRHFCVVEVAGSTPPVVDQVVRYANDRYGFQLNAKGFRYAFEDADGQPVASAHPESGLLLGLMLGNPPTVSPVQSTVVDEFEGDLLRATVTTANGIQARVAIEFHESHARFEVVPLGQPADARFAFDVRTAPMSPVYGLGDYGSHADACNDVNAPCNGNVGARTRADMTGFVRDEIINQGSCRRFVTNFAIFPKQGFAQVLFNNAKKRVGFTQFENRIGVADVAAVNILYYFTGDMERIYADYLAARGHEGYPDVKPRYTLFEVGWEAYGALGWNTFQEAVMDNIQTYLNLGFPLKWGVVGSGFWPGDRGSKSQGTTVSFGMWDSVAPPPQRRSSQPALPEPGGTQAIVPRQRHENAPGAAPSFQRFGAFLIQPLQRRDFPPAGARLGIPAEKSQWQSREIDQQSVSGRPDSFRRQLQSGRDGLVCRNGRPLGRGWLQGGCHDLRQDLS